ncbi:hypothetical protein F441_21226 [Phytophthora nicotianae CJ01A1]|uniref:Uncharacterized protein n=4 Tax=Phytophthora nicotianae TaxID=4792 RepID=V9DY14_PHYNI|nr:hypothetical protein F443_21328 [Phytophthora nicotianae P1569]ETO60446.1 hypothetical protein F444_21351 [Phytophthora nicotianae P1976]ETP01534.1 hypothetical protein F441_21226 [Phytophthora nicotianae CJ01A1]ETP29707.1 hypothetical protein F442_21167 [Phytophthora nicotianae P10297]
MNLQHQAREICKHYDETAKTATPRRMRSVSSNNAGRVKRNRRKLTRPFPVWSVVCKQLPGLKAAIPSRKAALPMLH